LYLFLSSLLFTPLLPLNPSLSLLTSSLLTPSPQSCFLRITPGARADLLLLDRSDYGPFRRRKVPFLFFSTGENPAYHTPADVAATLDYPKVEAGTRLILGVVRQASASSLLTYISGISNPLARSLAKVVEQTDGPLAVEIRKTLQEMALGRPTAEAIRDLGDRTGAPGLKRLTEDIGK